MSGGHAEAAAALLGETLVKSEALAGGDLSSVLRLCLGSGRTVVVKAGQTARTEAEMLRSIAAADAPAPRVLALTGDVLVLEDLGANEGPEHAWGDLGLVLRRLHAATGPNYGWPADYRFGPVPIPNASTIDWPAFWAERRLRAGAEGLPAELRRRVDTLCTSLADRLPRAPRPALLHGDLLSGNVVTAGGSVSGLVDPACYWGHADVDLAMLTLFDQPDAAFWTGYGALEPGHVARRPLYQLWPALVHLRLFGVGYRPLVEQLLTKAEGDG